MYIYRTVITFLECAMIGARKTGSFTMGRPVFLKQTILFLRLVLPQAISYH